jgi:hypothetical protein
MKNEKDAHPKLIRRTSNVKCANDLNYMNKPTKFELENLVNPNPSAPEDIGTFVFFEKFKVKGARCVGSQSPRIRCSWVHQLAHKSTS